MMHVSMKFHEIIFIRLEVVVRTQKKTHLTSISDLDGRYLWVVRDTPSNDDAFVY